MKVLAVGSGVIGTVYGAHLAAEGHVVSVLRHPPRTDQVAANGLRARDVLGGRYVHAPVSTVREASADQYDLVLVAVRADQLKAACAQLTDLAGSPVVVLFGNNPGGRSTVGGAVTGDVRQGFPGIGGVLRDGVADYVRIPQQPTALEAGSDPRLAELEQTLSSCGFPVQRVTDMDGWLLYHAAFIACVAAPCFAAAPIRSAWPPTRPRSASCAARSPRLSPACAGPAWPDCRATWPYCTIRC
jgi:2-dehydropantoate 2-reductase